MIIRKYMDVNRFAKDSNFIVFTTLMNYAYSAGYYKKNTVPNIINGGLTRCVKKLL